MHRLHTFRIVTALAAAAAALTGYREVVERVGQVRVLRLVLVADEGAIRLQQEVARPPVLDVLTCRRRSSPANRLHQPHNVRRNVHTSKLGTVCELGGALHSSPVGGDVAQ